MSNEDDRALALELLKTARTVAVLGAHPDPARPAHYVPAYLAERGYRIVPVNATRLHESLFGEDIRGSLTEIDEPVDVVDVFRPSEAVAGHLDEILAMRPRPGAVWLQLGIRDDATAERLRAAGIRVVQDLCMLAEHRRAGLGPVEPRA